MKKVLLFCQLGVATREVVGHIDAGFNGDDHARCQHSISVDRHCVMCVHAKIVTDMVRVETIHRLKIFLQKQCLLVLKLLLRHQGYHIIVTY